MSNDEEHVDEIVEFYSNTFPSATPIVYNNVQDHPFESRFQELYGNACFLIYKPFGRFSFKNKQSAFFLLLAKDNKIFREYVEYFFTNRNRENGSLRRSKIKCFGSVKLLMLNEDMKSLFREYKNAISLAFKDGKDPLSERNIAVYAYDDGKLVEMKEFFVWDKDVEKERGLA